MSIRRRGQTKTTKIYNAPGTVNISSGAQQWAKFSDGTFSASTGVPASLDNWAIIPVDGYRLVTLTFYTRVATVTTDAGTPTNTCTPVVKGLVRRAGDGTNLPAVPPECGKSWNQNSRDHGWNSAAMVRLNPSNDLGNIYGYAPGMDQAGNFVDFLFRGLVAVTANMEWMEQVVITSPRWAQEAGSASITPIGDTLEVTPYNTLFLAYAFNPGRNVNATFHADSGIYVTMER